MLTATFSIHHDAPRILREDHGWRYRRISEELGVSLWTVVDLGWMTDDILAQAEYPEARTA